MIKKGFTVVIILCICGLIAIPRWRSLISTLYRNWGNLTLVRAIESRTEQTENIQRSQEYLEKAIFLDPNQTDIYFSLGKPQVLVGNYSEAKSTFHMSPENMLMHSIDAMWLVMIGNKYLDIQNYDNAVEVLNVLKVLTAGHSEVYKLECEAKPVQTAIDRAWGFGNFGDYQAEEIAYKLVTALVPGCPDGYYRLGEMYFGQQKYTEAVESYQQGIVMDSKTNSCGYEYLAGVYLEQGQVDEAMNAAETALQNNGGPQANLILGRIHQLKGDLSDAQDFYLLATSKTSQCAQDDLSRWMAYFYMSWMAFDRKKYDLAIIYMRQASQVAPGKVTEPQALKYLGDIYHQLGMLPDAIHEYERAIELAPLDWEWAWNIHLALADTYRDDGQANLAVSEYEFVLKWIPSDSYVTNELAKLR